MGEIVVRPATWPDRDLGMPEPIWELATLLPRRSQWTEEDYFGLPIERHIELHNGNAEVLSMPTMPHQLILMYLLEALRAFVRARSLGLALPSGTRVRLWPGEIREPDIVFARVGAHRGDRRALNGADLVMEIVSEGAEDRKRDLVEKRQDYARAGIPEYWIVDPLEEHILVLALEGDAYQVHGEFARGSEATSVLLPGFTVSVDAVFDAAEE